MKFIYLFKEVLCCVAASIALVVGFSHQVQSAQESDYYIIEPVPIPLDEEGKEVVLEVGALERMPGAKMVAASRRGDIYLFNHIFAEKPKEIRSHLYAYGLHEPLGLAFKDNWLYVTQRPEVSRIADLNKDGRADLFETVNDEWGINGDYHEYAFGSKHDRNGDLWVVLCLTGSGGSASFLRGFCVRITPQGKMVYTASGIRSPGGIGMNHKGDMFYCDNQGFWNGSSSLKHLKPGSFQGNPTGNKWFNEIDTSDIGPRPKDPKDMSFIETERSKIKQLVPPAVVMPHSHVGRSPTGIVWDNSKGKFGPFAKQVFVGDQTFSNVQRVYLEEVNGVYQGAVFPFLSGFGSGNVALLMTEEGYLFVGGTNRGWGSTGKKPYALERVRWTGKTPFEVLEMKATRNGFELTFTEPVDTGSAGNKSSYEMKAWTYNFTKGYGSKEIDTRHLTIESADVSPDGLTVRLKVRGLVKGHVHHLSLPGVRSKQHQSLLHKDAFYTLNEIPKF